MSPRYEAVCGDDIECSAWASGEDATAVAEMAADTFATDIMQDGDEGDYTVTVYEHPVSVPGGDGEIIVGWTDRGTATAAVHSRTWVSVGRIRWDGEGQKPTVKP